ncbi:hypothetical protein [Streptomyces sp. NWU339]|uniref:hypothetical protein n=1 Tax=Streptomyces sp. NWU339 TaxID=2185284 RepID=UPI0015E82A88|nr:hypothetical protein [Streptomyces sp. NWU339]
MAGKHLTTQNALITTASVEVKTLTISGKQVTLAVFRQLREEPLISEDGSLNGDPWGVVNYHPEKCGNAVAHWHVVWQRGTEIFRAAVIQTPEFDPGPLRHVPQTFDDDAADRYVTSHVLQWLNGRTDQQFLKVPKYPGEHVSDSVTMSSPHGFKVTGYASKAATAALAAKGEMDQRAQSLASAREELSQPPTPFNTQEQKQQQVTRTQAALEKAQQQFRVACVALENEVAEWGSHAEISTALTEAVQAEAERRERHRASHATIAALPQLFIAV